MAVIAIHAGAGPLTDELRSGEAEILPALRGALTAGARALREGDALAAVLAAVIILEDFPLFNAGRGSALCADGSVELSASLMRGSDREAGAVAGMSHTCNPILGAKAVLESPNVLLIGARADAAAAEAGVEQCDPSYFVTARQQRRLGRLRPGDVEHGTVGAVCLDDSARLAAATSTGGITGQRPGRVGDSPLIGAGTWADAHAAISCTGDGEAFIRSGAARALAMQVEDGFAIGGAADHVLTEVGVVGGTGGLIAVDARGNVTSARTTEAMPHGIWRSNGEPVSVSL